MQLLTPLVPDPRAPLARANPIAKLGAGVLLLVALFASLDGVTAAIVLAGVLALLPFSGLSESSLAGLAWLIGLGAVSIALFSILFAPAQAGPTLVAIGPLRIGVDTAIGGAGLAARLVAIALTGILAVATSDPTALADGLVQQLRVSPRFAIGALAALRLVPRLALEWQTIALARRARGIDAGRNPVAAVRLFAGQLLGLLVAAIRLATRMATAMEARGFGALPARTVARPRRMRAGDWAWIAAAFVLGAGAIGVSLLLGTWRPLIG
jgi:energy-coupling factor transport system permease protein